MTEYHVSVPDAKLNLLKAKLSLTEFPDELDTTNATSPWTYGVPLSEIKRLHKYWLEDFSWRAQETKLNQLPNFHAQIAVDNFGSLDIHFLHQRSTSPDAIPLLFCHGWPGNYLEVSKLLPLLAQSHRGVSFHVVAPSLPNFGWSQGVHQPGFGLAQYAEVNHRLMQSLGYKQYVTQGGDWGFYITRSMGLLYPSAVLASHVNLIRASPPRWSSNPLLALQHAVTSYTDEEKEGLARDSHMAKEGRGYSLLQATKPQTLGYSLADSPVGLLAWMYEKMHDWTDAYPWTDDEILTWVSLYYFSTAGPAATLRIYYEAVHVEEASGGIPRSRVESFIPAVKLGLCHTPKEIADVPSTWARTLGPVVLESRKKTGGHFAAYEVPEAIVADLHDMFGSGGPCHQIVDRARL